MKSLTKKEAIALYILLLIVIFFTLFINLYHPCKKAIIYINSKAVCQTYGINKEKCEVQVNYCGEYKGFYEVEYKKNEKTQKDYINQNVVELIKFLTK